MTSQITNLEKFEERLGKLEKQNHRLKQMGVAALVVVASLVAMAQDSPKKVVKADIVYANEVEANKFVLKDENNKIRAMLSVEIGNPLFSLYDDDLDEGSRVNIGIDEVEGGIVFVRNTKGDTATLLPGRIEVRDVQGYMAKLGINELNYLGTGGTRKTSASSLMLYDKERKVIWEAP